MLDEKEQTWGCINAGSAFSPAYFTSSQLLPSYIIKSPTFALLICFGCPLNRLPTPYSAVLLSPQESASSGLQHGAAHRQMSWLGEAEGLEDAHCGYHQPEI